MPTVIQSPERLRQINRLQKEAEKRTPPIAAPSKRSGPAAESARSNMKWCGLIAAACILPGMLSTQAADYMKAYPPAEAGMVRHVLQLPPQNDESAYKVELIVGKIVLTDPANRYFFAGKIEEEIIHGWGFPCYKVRQLGPMAGTLMAPAADVPNVNRFITLGGEPYLIRYNSRLPIVVYAPEGVEVRYRIWTASPEAKTVEKG